MSIYDSANKILLSNMPFELLQNNDKILGDSIMYQLDSNEIMAKGVRGWFYK